VKGGDHVNKTRLIYLAVLACLVASALLTALAAAPAGMHDGARF
jgi:hypothetical protein